MNQRGRVRGRAGLLAFVLATCLGARADAPLPDAASGAATNDMPGLEAFVDGVMGAVMAQERIAGAQLAIVRNGNTVLLKGYGIDRLQPRRDVDPQRSLFRVGSISKTFTFIAIMQLVERGRLRLTDPINDHLPDELDLPDDGFRQPIRVVDLMNHTPGFEDVVQNLFAAENGELVPIEQHLRTHRPARVREPNTFMAYSNYGVALAGVIIARLSGVDFETYVEQNILAPLGMTHTTFREKYEPGEGMPTPMSTELAEDRSDNIEWRDGTWSSVPHEHIVSMAPAGAAMSSAADMARYMTALLDPQLLEERGVLKQDTYRQMTEPTFQSAPGMPAMHHGFFNQSLGLKSRIGLDNLSHAGATLHFLSFMVVIPDLSERAGFDDPAPASSASGNLGVFVTTNSSAGAKLILALPERILTQYFPRPHTAPAELDPIKSPLDYAGLYRSTRRSYTRFEKVLSLPVVATIRDSGDGRLVLGLGAEQARFVPLGEDLFRQETGDPRIAFVRDENGRVSHLVAETGSFERIGYLQSMGWLILIVVVTTLACLGVVGGAVIRPAADPSQSNAARLSAQLMVVASIAWLLFLLLCAFWAAPLLGPSGQDQFVYHYPQPILKAALVVLLVVSGLAVVMVGTLVPVWREGTWSPWRKVRHSLVALVLIALVATLSAWNLVGLRYY